MCFRKSLIHEFFTADLMCAQNEVEKVTSYTVHTKNLIDKVQKKVEGLKKGRCQIRYDESYVRGTGQDI